MKVAAMPTLWALLVSGSLACAGGSVLRLGLFVPFTSYDSSMSWEDTSAYSQYYAGEFRSIAVALITAARHFNARNGSVVSAFGSLGSCGATIEFDMWDTLASARGTVEAYVLAREANGGVTPYDAIVGPARSGCSAAIAQLCIQDRVLHMSYWSTSPDLDNSWD